MYELMPVELDWVLQTWKYVISLCFDGCDRKKNEQYLCFFL